MKELGEKYFLQINSWDRIVSTDKVNDCTFLIDWSFLPEKYTYYKVRLFENVNGGVFNDNTISRKTNAYVFMNLVNRLSYNTNTKSTSLLVGHLQRIYASSNGGNGFIHQPNDTSVIVARPIMNILRVQHQVINIAGTGFVPLVTGSSTVDDNDIFVGGWSIKLEFTPLE